MPKKVRCPFDITKEFYVIRLFKFGGRTWNPTDDKASWPWRRLGCTEREVFRFWTVRLLECKSEANIEGVNYPDAIQSTPKEEEIVKEEPKLESIKEPEPEPEKEPEPEPEEKEEVSKAKTFGKSKAEKSKK
jgi:hypothetical protein